MEWTFFVEIIAVPIIGWLIYMVTTTRKEIMDHKIHVAESYMTKDEAEKAENKIYDMLKHMNTKLDRLIERALKE